MTSTNVTQNLSSSRACHRVRVATRARLKMNAAFAKFRSLHGLRRTSSDDVVYQEDTQDDLALWSLNDLRNLTHAVRETFTYLHTEEDLFTDKADLMTSEYSAEELTCMLSTLWETSRKLAIVLAAALCDPNDSRMASHISLQDRDAAESEYAMLLKTLQHRAAVNALTDSKLSEMMQLGTLVPVLRQRFSAQAVSSSTTHIVSAERTHVDVTVSSHITLPVWRQHREGA